MVTALIVVGYLLTMLGAWLLYKNAPKDHGGHAVLLLPVTKGGPTNEAMAREGEGILERLSGNKSGAMLICIGTFLQLAAYLLSIS